MSHYVTPFLVLNLGSEMVYVVAQRLEAQGIPADKSNLVLDEIISVLISKQLITELMKPQAPYNHETVRDIIEDVTQSSAMRLDSVSMGKLWDLITMVYKWQLTISNEVIKITLRHLYEIETYVTNPETHLELHRVQNLIDNFNKILGSKEKEDLYDDLMFWLKECNIRVSLLLRMGLQDMDGTFVTENLDPIAEEMLRNLGENIYSVTNNGRVLENGPSVPQREVGELQLFVDQILGRRTTNSTNDQNQTKSLQLTIDDQNNVLTNAFNDIDARNGGEDQFKKLMDELNVNDNTEDGCLKDELLDMIGGEEEKVE